MQWDKWWEFGKGKAENFYLGTYVMSIVGIKQRQHIVVKLTIVYIPSEWLVHVQWRDIFIVLGIYPWGLKDCRLSMRLKKAKLRKMLSELIDLTRTTKVKIMNTLYFYCKFYDLFGCFCSY